MVKLYNSRCHRLQFLHKIAVVFSLKIFFALANSVDPDTMPHYAALSLGLLCLQLLLQLNYALTE